MTDSKIRTRFAPSPTGFLHIGGLRTALYSYLFAKKNKGSFILRIEDTDTKRKIKGAVENLIKTLWWAGIKNNEGVFLKNGKLAEKGKYGSYIQSKRIKIYKKYAKKLIESESAYYCFCSETKLAKMRKQQEKEKKAPMYDRTCLNLKKEETKKKIDIGMPYVVRLKIPEKNIIEFDDLVRGKLKFKNTEIDDQILLKSDGYPTYHLASVIDDHLMGITHVIRGEEWLPSTPKHIVLYEAFGWKIPLFAHLPLLLNKEKKKLSKREGHTTVEEYIREGYLAEAVINFVSFLGWNPGTTQEIFTINNLIKKFSFARVHKSGAVFDVEKLNWMNRKYIRELHIDKLTEKVKDYIPAKYRVANHKLQIYVETIRDRLQKLSDAPKLLKFYLEEPDYNIELILNEKMKVTSTIAIKGLTKSLEVLKKIGDFKEKNIKIRLLELISDLGLKNGQLLWPIRACLTGEKFSPGAFEVACALGKKETLKRIKKALEKLKN